MFVEEDFDVQIQDFDDGWDDENLEVPLRQEVLNVTGDAVAVVESLPNEDVVALATPRIDTVSVSGVRPVVEEDDGWRACTGEKVTKTKVLEWGAAHNRAFLNSYLRENRAEVIQELGALDDPDDLLRKSRILRSSMPMGNKLGRKLTTGPYGHSTLGKFMYGVQKWNLNGRTVVFGVRNPKQGMSMLKAEKYVDRFSINKGKFVEGDINDWRKFVTPRTKIIISDCSDGDGEGVSIRDDLWQVYEDMYKAGLKVMFKWDITKEREVAGYYKYRMHNKECICLFGDGVQLDPGIHLWQGNMDRNIFLLYPRCAKPAKRMSWIDPSVLERQRTNFVPLEREGTYDLSILSKVTVTSAQRLKQWRRLCLTENYIKGVNGGMELGVELPAVLQDLRPPVADVERYFASFMEQCEMEYDVEFGWVAVDEFCREEEESSA